MWGKPTVAEASMTLQQPEAHRVFSRGSCPWITGPWQWRAAQAPRGCGQCSVLAHRILGGCSSSVSVSCPSLVSVLIAVAHAVSGACLGSVLDPISSSTPKQWCLGSQAGPDFFPDSLLVSCGALAPFRLCSRSQPQSSPWNLTSKSGVSAPSPCPSRQVSRQASQAGECWSPPILCAGTSLFFSLHPCCCTLLHGSKASLLPTPRPRQ